MSDAPSIQHWLVQVARAAELPGAGDLDVDPETSIGEAWSTVAGRTGLDDGSLARQVADHYRLALADLDSADPTATRLLPGRTARSLVVLPLRYTDRSLTIASSDPVGMESEREIGTLSSRSVTMEIAPPAEVTAAVEKAYPRSAEPDHQLPSIPPDGRNGDGGPHILVVDDDPGARTLLRTALESRGFQVTEAPDGRDALEILELERVHLVTLDLRMVEMDGLEVLRTMRSRTATAMTPVVVATGSDDPEVEMEALEAGADDFVVKPVDPPRFLLRIQAVLRRYGVSHAAVRG